MCEEEKVYILSTIDVIDGELITVEQILDEDFYKLYISIFGGDD